MFKFPFGKYFVSVQNYMKNCFDFQCYKEFLLHTEGKHGSLQKGFRTKLADAIGTQNAYVSKVLNGDAQLNLEQGFRLSLFLKLQENEQQYLLWMIEYARAGTPQLKQYFKRLMAQLRNEHLNIKYNVGQTFFLDSDAQATYYSHWLYGAVHAIASIPGMQSASQIAKALNVNKNHTEEVILFLIKYEILEQKNGRLITGKTQIHLDKTSPNIYKHHTNWRVKAIESLYKNSKDDLHYSTVSSLSANDVAVIKKKLVQVVKDYVDTVRNSPEEAIYSFNLDFYSLVQN